MEKLRRKIDEIQLNFKKPQNVDHDTLREYGLKEITLRDYQLAGVNWLISCHKRKHGCILADEMGLGKTCQTIAFLTNLQSKAGGSFLILSPLSVLNNWQSELARFAPGLDVMSYVGDKETRAELRSDIKRSRADTRVILTTYEICLKDESFLGRMQWRALVVDEAHRLKNRQSLLHQALLDFDIEHRVLLTGTPVQNNLRELYALLCFVAPRVFREKWTDDFVEKFTDISPNDKNSEIHELLRPFILRRLKSEVVRDLPQRSDVVLYHGISAIQKRYYRAILMKDTSIFDTDRNVNRSTLLNTLMQLRKCVNHPYLFDGVEPEPFVLGEHLVEASGKLQLLDQLLRHLQAHDHKVLLFSQFTRVLDILQDYLGYRGYTYERLDGSVRGEERFAAVKSFNQDSDTFLFLLSTKAGGVGLNLVGADTVIFVDSDFNPQNDLQAAARAHRIGQTRPVKVIRLIGKNTCEEIILKRAEAKLKLTESVMERGHFSHTPPDLLTDKEFKLSELMKFGVESLLSEDTGELEDVDFDTLLGASKDGEWTVEDSADKEVKDEPSTSAERVEGTESMYVFEGTDYRQSQQPTEADIDAFDQLLQEEQLQAESAAVAESRGGRTCAAAECLLPQRKARTPLTQPEKEALRKRRAELAEERQKKTEEAKLKRQEQAQKRKEALWKKNGYISCNIALPDNEDEDEAETDKQRISVDDGDDDDVTGTQINYVMGDVTQPQSESGQDAIVVHCVDDSGSWGSGGLFSALDRRSDRPAALYSQAADMKDLQLGDAHLINIEESESDAGNDTTTGHNTTTQAANKTSTNSPDKAHDTQTTSRDTSASRDVPSTSRDVPSTSRDTNKRHSRCVYVSLMITQHRDRKGVSSGILLSHLATALQRVAGAAHTMKASVHLPRIGYSTPGFNWYGTERLIRKHLASRGLPTYIYYFPRKKRRVSLSDSEISDSNQPFKKRRKMRDDSDSDKKRTKSQDISDSDSGDEYGNNQNMQVKQRKRQESHDLSDSDSGDKPRRTKLRKLPTKHGKSRDISDSEASEESAKPSRRHEKPQSMSDSEDEANGHISTATKGKHGGLTAQTSTLTRLPDFMQGVRCYLRVQNSALCRKLTRYLIAYGGDVHSSVTPSTTHVVLEKGTSSTKDEAGWREENSSIETVAHTWLLDCFSQRKVLPLPP